MSLDFMTVMKYQAELSELEQIDNQKEVAFRNLELLLKGHMKYEQIKAAFSQG